MGKMGKIKTSEKRDKKKEIKNFIKLIYILYF